MSEQDQHVLGEASAMLTPAGYNVRPTVQIGRCIREVPPAADAILGTCPYYYRPLHGAYLETVEKVSVLSIWETVKAFATSWDPWTDKEVARRLLHRREQLIAPDSSDSDWSRHGNFMMRHIGCGHRPPSYYVSYGYYYCSTYGEELRPRLSDAGKVWLDNARWMLQKNMELGLMQNNRGDSIFIRSQKGNGEVKMAVPRLQIELMSDTFHSFAFQTHPPAYLDAGLADLPLSDLTLIGLQPNIEEWADGRTWDQALSSGLRVLEQKTIGDDAGNVVAKALDRLLAK